MAQTDTGLGWSAKDTWLTNGAPVTVAKISGWTGATQLPVATTSAELLSNGLRLGTYQSGSRHTIACYIGSAPGKNCATFFIPRSNYNQVYAVSLEPSAPIYWYRYDETAHETWIDVQIFYTSSSPRSGTDLYSTLLGDGPLTSASAVEIPVYTSVNEAFASISMADSPFLKVVSGYAVACVAKWKTPNGTVLESPILISSDSNLVEMQTTIPGINLAKLNILYSGRRFYMAFYDRPYDNKLETDFPVIDRSYSDAPTFTLEELFRYIAKDVYANILVLTAPDPYSEEDEESGEGGGDGEDDESDEIPFTDAPVSGIAYSGFLTIFTPNLSQLQSLANYMWSDFFDVDTWKKLFANPMDAILGLHIIPCSPGYSGNKEVKVGGKGTGVSMDYTTIRYHEVSMGTCNVPKKWGSYLDYNPYTKMSIFLPYIGFRDLDTDDVMDRTLALQYIVDILTGACVAELRCGTDVLYSWEGNCANPVPITSNSWASAIGSAVSIAAAIATTALTHGASAPMIAGTVASVGANSMNLKPSVSRSGSLGGSGGFIAKQTPYIIRTVPNLVIPSDQNKFIGYPSFVTTSLGNLTGYNEISSIHLEGIPATGNELSEIETLLKGGVIF